MSEALSVTQGEIDAVREAWYDLEEVLLTSILLGREPDSFTFELTLKGQDYEGAEAVRAFLDRFGARA